MVTPSPAVGSLDIECNDHPPSTGFSPNDLVFGHTVWGPLAVLQTGWKKPLPAENLLDYVNGFKRQLYESVKMARLNLETAPGRMKRLYDRQAEEHVCWLASLIRHSDPVQIFIK